MYIHIPKEKRTKLDPSRKKGIFVGYSESSKAYRIYFHGYKNIDISRDVTFDEDIDYNKSRKRPVEEPEEVEVEVPRIHDTTMNKEYQEEDHLYIHLRRIILIRGNLLGYEKLSKVLKDMGLQKKITEKERDPDPIPSM